MDESCFGAYDIRGIYPEQVNEKLAYAIGRVFPDLIKGKKIAVGRDVRLSGQPLHEALVMGLLESGAEVTDLSMVGTEEVYFAVTHLALDGGIMITASHNPKKYNGMKFVVRESMPLSRELFMMLEKRVAEEDYPQKNNSGIMQKAAILPAYIESMLSYVDVASLKPYKVVVDAGNGAAGPVIEAMEKFLPFNLFKIGCKPDGDFPKGVPNPLLPENRISMAEAVKTQGADFGVAWDGDFDRCFIYDEQGRFIDSCYVVGFLAQVFLGREKGAGIVYDSRVVYNIEDVIKSCGGRSIISRSGHVLFKRKMRENNAVYGGEMSGHHYFRDFSYCDSGMLPWLLMAGLLSRSGKRMSQLLDERMERFPVSGEMNFEAEDSSAFLELFEKEFCSQGTISKLDGLSADMGEWRLNLRASNTEPLLRLNVESRGDTRLCMDMAKKISKKLMVKDK